MRYTLLGQQCENTLYFFKDTGVTVESMQLLCAALVTAFGSVMPAALPSAMLLRELYATDLTTQDAPAFTYDTGLPIAGTNGSPPLPNNTALCVSFRTDARGRSARGRNYLMGLTEAVVVGNTVTNGFYDAWLEFYEEMQTGAEAHDYVWGVFSRRFNNAPRTVGLFRAITAVTVVDDTVDSQRRRLPGRGR